LIKRDYRGEKIEMRRKNTQSKGTETGQHQVGTSGSCEEVMGKFQETYINEFCKNDMNNEKIMRNYEVLTISFTY
jgi:hypothetical protein